MSVAGVGGAPGQATGKGLASQGRQGPQPGLPGQHSGCSQAPCSEGEAVCHCLTTEVTDLGGEAGTPLLSGLTPLSPAPVPPLWDIHSCNVRLIDDLTTLGFPDCVPHEGRTALPGSCCVGKETGKGRRSRKGLRGLCGTRPWLRQPLEGVDERRQRDPVPRDVPCSGGHPRG